MKKLIILLFTVLLVFLAGCNPLDLIVYEHTYSFLHDFEEIISIDIVKKEYDTLALDVPIEVLTVVDPAEHRTLIDAFVQASGANVYSGPPGGYGLYIVRIHYKNGEVEMIGNYNTGYIDLEGTAWQTCYMFNRDDFFNIISQYVEVEGVTWDRG